MRIVFVVTPPPKVVTFQGLPSPKPVVRPGPVCTTCPTSLIWNGCGWKPLLGTSWKETTVYAVKGCAATDWKKPLVVWVLPRRRASE